MFSFRFLVEFLKEDQVSSEATQLINNGQILSIPFVLVGIFMMIRSKKIDPHQPLVSNTIINETNI